MDDRFWHLKNCDLFERLTADELELVESRSRVKTFKRSSLIYLPTDSGNSILLLTSGRVKIYHLTAEGKQALLALIDPGELFGELAVLDSGQRDEFAEAMEASTLVMIPRDVVSGLMTTHPAVALSVSRLMGLRRKKIERRLKSLLFRSNRERLVHLLMELAEKYGRLTPDGLQIDVKLSHQELANIIGSTRETVTVILGELQHERSVIVRRRQIILTQPDQLAASIDLPAPQIPRPTDLRNPVMQSPR
ncbi:MAG: Crp/Fnr family transcriptional regulator [Proteobacteria bacterium]|nr:Crp/Fnr family transcriptional regulator [Pseudomonadota bacterium]